MNREFLEKRLEEIENTMKQLLANYNAMEGAKQEVLNWLKKFDEIKDSELS